jgi:formylglycine-generating enzyme required for sulfatase activity
MGTTVQQQREKASGSKLYGEGDNYPMYYVSWYEAVEYCNKRSQKEGLTPAYTINGTNVTWNRSASGYRLPTEAEWEYACRAGTTTAYNTGASITDDTGWYRENSGDTTHPVGQKPANAWGLYDMHGNVWEWCWDWYGDYPSGAQTDPIGASSGSICVRRGGGWPYAAQYARSAYRGSFTPFLRFAFLGFRVVRPAQYGNYPSVAQADPVGVSSGSDRVLRGGSWISPAQYARSAYRRYINPDYQGDNLGFRLARSGQ